MPSGLFMGKGGFMIYGKKNFLYPAKLEIGYGLLFKIDKSSLKNHINERQPLENMDEEEMPGLYL